jgi:hypothetical protein
MNENQVLLPTFDYMYGKQVTEKLRKVLDLKSSRALSEAIGVPTSTIATWQKRKICPYELAIRAHIRKGISLKWLLLDEGPPYPNAALHEHQSRENEKKKLIDIDLFVLKNGKLLLHGTMTLDQFFLDELEISNVIAVRDGNRTYVVDQESIDAINGVYLIDLDGLLSVNDIQRLPEKKLALNFNGETLVISADSVKVSGQIVLEMTRK